MADSPETGGVQETAEAQPVLSVNFFTPRSEFSKDNKRLISILAIIWAVAVFGFQFLLVALQSPTPEPIHGEYKAVWAKVEAGKASAAENKTFARATLRVLGKNIAVKGPHKETLKKALSSTVLALVPAGQQAMYKGGLGKEGSPSAGIAIKAIGLKDEGFDKLMKDFVPHSLVAGAGSALAADVKKDIPGIMDLYLIHNRSVLTDMSFMGFPFHYWFTAQFLLILFVLLCLTYAKLIDRVMIKHGRMTKDKA